MKKFSIASVLIVLLAGCSIQPVVKPNQNINQPLTNGNTNGSVACSMEAKLCPDGSAVGRTGPNCEFAPCPGVNSTLSEDQARVIAEKSCIKGGEALSAGTYNEITKTWWFDANLNATQSGCNPACVVSEASKTAEINWRCTGLIEPGAANDNTTQNGDKGVFITRSGFQVTYDKTTIGGNSQNNLFQLSVAEIPGSGRGDQVIIFARAADFEEYVSTIYVFPIDKKLTEMANVIKDNSSIYQGEKCNFIKKVNPDGTIVYDIVLPKAYTLGDPCGHDGAESGYMIFKDNNQYIVYYANGQDSTPSQNFTIAPVKK